MESWDRGDVEMAIAIKRAEINRALSYKKYDAEDHNICLALVRYKDGSSDVLSAYSNDSAIPESIRLGLDLIPNVYGDLKAGQRFGCDGMAQYHTEPKLLNYLCATPTVRKGVIGNSLPKNKLYKQVLHQQRTQASAQAERLKSPNDIAAITLVTEIDCCPTCTEYSIRRFRQHFPDIQLDVIELGKVVRDKTPPNYTKVRVSKN